MTTEEAARRWAATWERAWREHDADAIVELYADEAAFRSSPFREPLVGPAGVRQYVEWAFADEEEGGNVRFGEPVVVAADRAVVEYWARVRAASGGEATIAGVSLLDFDERGRVTAQRDYWNHEPANRPPHADFGR